MSDLVELEHINTPEPSVQIEPVGEGPDPVVHEVDWEQMQHPTPQMFLDVHEIHSDMIVFLSNVEDADPDWMEEAEAAQEALDELLQTMVGQRTDLNNEKKRDLGIGDITVLPEVLD